MVNETTREIWYSRARNQGQTCPDHLLGYECGGWMQLPCIGTDLAAVPVPVYGTDVLAFGDCLYHAVWKAAQWARVVCPFGFDEKSHVIELRVRVAIEVVSLFEEEQMDNSMAMGSLDIGNLVAQPRQYLRCSSEIPITATARMLNRMVVVLSSDGIFDVYPTHAPFLTGEITANGIVVIYHCAAGRITDAVTFGERNHYIPVFFGMDSDRNNLFELFHAFALFGETTFLVACMTQPVSYSIKLTTAPEKTARLSRLFSTSATADNNTSTYRSENLNGEKEQLSDDTTTAPDAFCDELTALIATATTLTELTLQELQLLSRNYTRHPRLALLYFHCRSTHPAACVHNDEVLADSMGEPTVQRLEKVLDEPISAETMHACQERVSKTAGSAGDLWVCASCCELINTVDSNISFMAICNLHDGFKLTAPQRIELDAMPAAISKQHVQALRIGGEVYHLNLDLVPDLSSIPLCSSCVGDPRLSEFSIASGHDYGRIGCLPELMRSQVSVFLLFERLTCLSLRLESTLWAIPFGFLLVDQHLVPVYYRVRQKNAF